MSRADLENNLLITAAPFGVLHSEMRPAARDLLEHTVCVCGAIVGVSASLALLPLAVVLGKPSAPSATPASSAASTPSSPSSAGGMPD